MVLEFVNLTSSVLRWHLPVGESAWSLSPEWAQYSYELKVWPWLHVTHWVSEYSCSVSMGSSASHSPSPELLWSEDFTHSLFHVSSPADMTNKDAPRKLLCYLCLVDVKGSVCVDASERLHYSSRAEQVRNGSSWVLWEYQGEKAVDLSVRKRIKQMFLSITYHHMKWLVSFLESHRWAWVLTCVTLALGKRQS